jgi:hypothetical protein
LLDKEAQMTLSDRTAESAVEDPAAAFDHWDPAQAADPHRIFEALREKCPVAHSDRHGGFWIITRYRDVEEICKNPAVFSSRYTSVPRGMFGDFVTLPPIQLDPPEHTAFRRLLLPSFTPQAVARWEETIRKDCVSLIGAFVDRGHCDASVEFAKHIPVRLMATMLGMSPEDEEVFASWLHRILEVGGTEPEQALSAAGEMWGYLSRLIEEHRQTPKDDLVGLLIESEVEGQQLNDQDLLGAIFLLILAGMDTSWGMIGSSLLHLANHPEDRARLVAEPGLLETAIEEFVRYYAPVLEGRATTQPVEFGGAAMEEGESVLLCFGSANRDPEAFEDADKVIIDRPDNRHFGFGVGVHRCLGAPLARLELRVALEEWLTRIPEFWLEDPAAVTWSTGQLWGPRRVPLAFPPGGGPAGAPSNV